MADAMVAGAGPSTRRPNQHAAFLVITGCLAAAALGTLPIVTALAAVVVGIVAVGMWRRPPLGIAALVLSVPLQDVVPVTFGDLAVTWTRLLTATVLAVWLLLVGSGRVTLRSTPLLWAGAAYVVALAASVVSARDLSPWAAETYRWSVAMFVLAIASTIVRARRDAAPILAALGIGVFGSFIIAVGQVVSGSGPESFAARGMPRAYGFFGEPNPFAVYLELATLPLMAALLVAWRERRSASRPLASGALALASGAGFVALVLTQSRGGALGFAVGSAVLIWAIWPRAGARLVITAALAVGVFVLTPVAAPLRAGFGVDDLTRATAVQVTPRNFAAQERLAHWGAAVRMWRDHPWLGVGAGNFSVRFREYTPAWRFRISRGHAHSAYLQAGAQAGLIGAAAYVAVLAVASGMIVGRGRRVRGGWAPPPAGGLAVTTAIAVHGVFEYVHVLSLGIVLSTVWAMAMVRESDDVDEPLADGRD